MTLPSVEVAPSLLHKPSSQVVSNEDKLFIRDLIKEAESVMMESDARVEIPPQYDHFADGMYARELFMPAGLVITSKIHKTNHFCFVLKGRAIVVDENAGDEFIEAPCMIKTKAGTKRILKILEDSVWVTVHATEETDVSEIEKEIISESHLEALT